MNEDKIQELYLFVVLVGFVILLGWQFIFHGFWKAIGAGIIYGVCAVIFGVIVWTYSDRFSE